MGKSKIYLLMIGIMFFWGMNVVALKLLVSYFSPLTMTALRIFLAALTVLLIVIRLKKVRRLSRQEWKWVMLGSILGVVIHHMLLATGMAHTSAVKTSIIIGFSPLVTAVFAVIFRFSRFQLLQFTGFALGAFGVVLAVINDGNVGHSLELGDTLIFLAIVSQALSFLVIRKVSAEVDSFLLTGYMLLFGSVILLISSLVFERERWPELVGAPPEYYLVLFGSAILATAVGQTAYNYAISRIGAAETAIFGNFNTIFALLGTAVFLHETIRGTQIIGCLLIIIGVLLGTGALQELINKRRAAKEDA
ncbi:MAG: DMT family transporter [Lysinibacillus sp.]